MSSQRFRELIHRVSVSCQSVHELTKVHLLWTQSRPVSSHRQGDICELRCNARELTNIHMWATSYVSSRCNTWAHRRRQLTENCQAGDGEWGHTLTLWALNLTQKETMSSQRLCELADATVLSQDRISVGLCELLDYPIYELMGAASTWVVTYMYTIYMRGMP